MRPIRVLIVDDQKLFRDGLRMLLSTDSRIEVVGEASDGAEAITQTSCLRPEVILMDLRMPGVDGVTATERLRDSPARVIALTTFSDDALVFDAIRAGATAYILKDAGIESIIAAIESARAGRSVLAPSVVGKVMEEFSRMAAQVPTSSVPPDLGLTERELDVLRMLSRGASNRAIARALSITEGTVRNHLSSIYKKLGVRDRTEAALRARRYGLG